SEPAFHPSRWIRRPGAARPQAGSVHPPSFALARADFLDQLRHDLVDIAHDPEVRQLEDRRLWVLVDGDDRPGTLHPDRMLHGARDAQRDVDRRLDGRTGLPDLERVRFPTGINDRAAGADRRAPLGRQDIYTLDGL